MSDLIIAIDTSLICEGKVEEVETLVDELVAYVEKNEPDILAYQVYIDAERERMTVVQVHASSASMEFHMEVAAPIFRRFEGLLHLASVDFFGSPSAALLGEMRRKAALLGGASVVVHETAHGFSHLAREQALLPRD
jgi:quinol monooxygenase YgiN